MTTVAPPQDPAGEFRPEPGYSEARRIELIAEIEQAPTALAQSLAGLNDQQLDVKYRNWTIRQIARHLADSHVHSYIRFKWALTEDAPLIKAYDENLWSALPEARSGDPAASTAMLSGVHACWVETMRAMTTAEWARGFNHPETGKLVVLSDALVYYAWHGRHHTGQIQWLRQHNGCEAADVLLTALLDVAEQRPLLIASQPS
jgi:hypothetical protein